jgi:hypothetical protein
MLSAKNGKAASGKEKPVCPYGSSCYSKNPQHIKEISHPAGHKPNSDENHHNDGDDDDADVLRAPTAHPATGRTHSTSRR